VPIRQLVHRDPAVTDEAVQDNDVLALEGDRVLDELGGPAPEDGCQQAAPDPRGLHAGGDVDLAAERQRVSPRDLG
jgi:hypothetical protein